jgi:hypothetical protein
MSMTPRKLTLQSFEANTKMETSLACLAGAYTSTLLYATVCCRDSLIKITEGRQCRECVPFKVLFLFSCLGSGTAKHSADNMLESMLSLTI